MNDKTDERLLKVAHMLKIFKTTIIALICAAAVLCCGCTDTKPQYHADITPIPTEEPTPEPTEEPTPTPTAQPTATPAATQQSTGGVDALGVPISGTEHYMRYITFSDMIVYEEDGGTFLDGIINNSYPEEILCAVSIIYYDIDGMEIAKAPLQTRDGQYLLVLAPGENVVYATILTDISLVENEYILEFDPATGVHPRS